MTETDVRPIPFTSCERSLERDWPRLRERLEEIVGAGVAVDGAQCAALERELAAYTGAAHVVLVNSASDALILGLAALGVGPGDEVIVPDYTFFASISAVLHLGAVPVIVDVEAGRIAMDPELVAAAVTPRTKVIMPVHLFNQMADMERLVRIADAHGIAILEDSAESIGMRLGERHAGRFGPIGVVSFFPSKTLGAMGDAGCLLTDDAELAEWCRERRSHGALPSDAGDDGAMMGSRCDEVQAAILRTRLEHLDEDIARRATLAERYSARLGDVAELTPPAAAPPEQGRTVWYVYMLLCDRRDALVAWLAKRGVETEIYYPRTLSAQPCLAVHDVRASPTPVAGALTARALGLPLHADLTEDEVDVVCDLIVAFYEQARR